VPRHVSGDPVRTRQIPSDFVTNALKFTPHGAIELDVRTTLSGHVWFAVRDTGSGGPCLARRRMLLVEDNAVNRLSAATLLAKWGLDIVQADDGRQAVEAVARDDGRFDAVLMDVHMPVMSGHEATVELRKRYGKERLPIITLTAAALVSEQEQSLALGMNDFVSKPFDQARLRDALAIATRECG
jgi:CheY-like chemotaxis protein